MYILCSNEILKANFIVADTSYHTQRVNDGWFDNTLSWGGFMIVIMIVF